MCRLAIFSTVVDEGGSEQQQRYLTRCRQHATFMQKGWSCCPQQMTSHHVNDGLNICHISRGGMAFKVFIFYNIEYRCLHSSQEFDVQWHACQFGLRGYSNVGTETGYKISTTDVKVSLSTNECL